MGKKIEKDCQEVWKEGGKGIKNQEEKAIGEGSGCDHGRLTSKAERTPGGKGGKESACMRAYAAIVW
jgi:hypothetical protein